MIPFPNKKYGVIYVDVPWSFSCYSPKGMGRSAENHYKCMTLADIKDLPVSDLAAKDCVLLMWVTDPMLVHGLEVMKTWGFQYKTVGFTWVKTNKDSTYFLGQGYHSRSNPEMCLLGTRGHPKRKAKDVRQLVVSQRREHSRKPDAMYGYIERLYDGEYCELFSRSQHPGWDSWGNETDKFNEQYNLAIGS